MLKSIDINNSLSKKEYKKAIKPYESRLASLQQKLKELEIPVVVVFDGWSCAGKGVSIARLTHALDPRDFNVYSMSKTGEEAALRPALWNYFIKLPPKGKIAFFDRSWHGMDMVFSSDEEKDKFYEDVNFFEKQLVDDGMIIIKFFLHIDKACQKERFKILRENPFTAWKVDDKDLEQNKKYEKYFKIYDNILERTNNDFSPWHVIESVNNEWALLEIFEIVALTLEKAVAKAIENSCELVHSEDKHVFQGENILANIDLSKKISPDEYEGKLKKLQDKLFDLESKLYTKRRPVIIVYEGWDAAGKGGNIKRLTEELDPRGYEVIPIGAPSREELKRHYLWRFWCKMPKSGHIGIFDRSWYGRVMVERVEKLTPVRVWERAYEEINQMEKHFFNHGGIIFKFWLHIDKDEQLKRFEQRQANPLKQHKITDEDWRNREKWDLYQQAVNEMLEKTNFSYAPWVIIESNDKKYARIKVLECVCNVLEKKLGI